MQTQYQRLSDPQWDIVRAFLPIQRKRFYDLRQILDAIFWYLRVGSQCGSPPGRNLPDSFPKWQSVYSYFRKWQNDGVLERLNTELTKLERVGVGKPETLSLLSAYYQSFKVDFFINEDKGVYGNKKINGLGVPDGNGLFLLIHWA